MELGQIVYKIDDNIITEFVTVRILSCKSLMPYGTFGFDESDKIGIVKKTEFDLKKEKNGISCKDNPTPYVIEVREKDIFATKELLIQSLK